MNERGEAFGSDSRIVERGLSDFKSLFWLRGGKRE
jgi:hypothetical protein